MKELVTFAIDTLAVIRLTRLVLEDEITDDIREIIYERFDPSTTKLGYLFTCPWCVSIWAGAVIFGLRAANPTLANVLSGLLAASMLTGTAKERGLT